MFFVDDGDTVSGSKIDVREIDVSTDDVEMDLTDFSACATGILLAIHAD